MATDFNGEAQLGPSRIVYVGLVEKVSEARFTMSCKGRPVNYLSLQPKTVRGEKCFRLIPGPGLTNSKNGTGNTEHCTRRGTFHLAMPRSRGPVYSWSSATSAGPTIPLAFSDNDSGTKSWSTGKFSVERVGPRGFGYGGDTSVAGQYTTCGVILSLRKKVVNGRWTPSLPEC